MRQIKCYSYGFLLALFFLVSVPAITASAATLEGTVTANQLNVRSSPSTTSAIIAKLKKDDKVVIKESLQEWYKVQVQSKEGYVSKQYIKIAEVKKEPITANQTKIIVNGEKLPLEFEPPMENNRILVPFRAIGEALGIDVSWSQEDRQVIARDAKNNQTVVFKIDDQHAIVNNENFQLETAPKLYQNRTLLPLRFFAETFGAQVNWDQPTRTVTVNRVVKVEDVQEDVKSISTVQFEGLTAKVIANTLNVRQGPNTTEPIMTKLIKNQVVTVIGSQAEWLHIRSEGVEGYIHSGYVELFDTDFRIKGLASPTYDRLDDRGVLNWSKLGGTTVKAKLEENKMIITSDANLVEKMDLINGVIKSTSYEETESGTIITVQFREGYTAVIYDSFDRLTITVMKKSASGKRIVLDAGHGGKDPGAIANGLEEKEIVLDVSLRVQELLEDAGIEVLMTRVDDTFLELQERVALGNAYEADAFVSIHANAATNTNANGTETYWNSTYNGEQSKRLAEIIHQSLIKKLGTTDRGVKQANFQVIRNSKMPSVLIELGFMTNKKDAELMASDEFRQKSAEAIFEGIIKFYQ